jgi:hypothetical protein
MAKKKAASKKKTTAKRDVLVVASKIKDYIKSKGLQSSGEVVPALSEKIYAMIDEATGRTKENKRSTVRPHDL